MTRQETKRHTGLDDTGLDSADRDCADTTDLVDVLERETEGLVGGSGRGLDGVDGLEKGLTLGNTGLGLLGPSLVPGHAARKVRKISRDTIAISLTWWSPPTCCHRANQRWGRRGQPWGCNRPS